MSKRILIVDDEEAIRRKLEIILSDQYITKQAGNGQEAIEMMSHFYPDLILLDVSMPVMNGLDACKAIRENRAYRYTKVIIVSGEVSLNDRMNGYKAGADDYIKKPFDYDELLAKIHIMLRLKHVEEIDQIMRDSFRLFSHESRTPLSGIMGFSSLIMQDPKGRNVKEFAESIYVSGKRLLSFADKVSRFCDLRNYKGISRISYPLANYLNENIPKFTKENDKRIDFEINCSNNINLNADWNLLEQVFQALIDNALKFSPEDGKITIDVENHEDSVKIAIADQGPGVSEEALPRLFSPLTVGDMNHHTSGSGLSIAIAKEIVDLHEGQIFGANRKKGGAIFTILLPG